jgi:hypothetical protein
MPPGGSVQPSPPSMWLRWVTLTGTATDEAGLPAEPGFRAAFSSCLDAQRRRQLLRPLAAAAGTRAAVTAAAERSPGRNAHPYR